MSEQRIYVTNDTEEADYVTEAMELLGNQRTGFQSPNYTQVPNDLFDFHMAQMGDAELRVVMAIVRQTIGYHRERTIFSISKLERMTGLSRNGVKAGAEAAEKRGLIERLNPDEQSSAEWGLVVTPSANDPLPPQPVTPRGSASDPQLGLNKVLKKANKGGGTTATGGLIFTLFEQNIGLVYNTILAQELGEYADLPEGWLQYAFKEAADSNARNWRFVRAVLENCKSHNGIPPKPSKKKSNGHKLQQKSAAQRWLEKKQEAASGE